MLPLIFLLAVGAAAIPAPDTQGCVVGDWGPWSQCVTTTECSTAALTGVQGQSHALPVSAAWDLGRDAMTQTMERKLQHYSQRVSSLEVGQFQGINSCTDGMAGEIPCWNVDQLAFLDLQQLGYVTMENDNFIMGNDIWGWTDPITGDEYAIVGLSGGTSFVRITDPTNPFTVAFMYTHTVPTIWRDIKVIGNFAYVVSEATDHGMQVFDLTRLRGVNSFISHAQPDVHYNKVGNSHNIVSNDETGYVYIVGAWATGDGAYTPCAGGLHAVDVRNPFNPTFAGCYAEDGYTHDAQCVIYRGPDARYFGREVCFAYNEDSLTIVDVSDKSNMKMISKRTYDGVMYSHQGWVTTDMTLLLLDDELDEWDTEDQRTKTHVWDIHDLENPILKTTHIHPHESIDHNQYVKGPFVFQSNYESGLRIMYIDREEWDIREVGFFDVYPSQTTAGWQGTWSVYPYYSSGTVVISSIDYGLFVVRPNWVGLEMEMMTPSGAAQGIQMRMQEPVAESSAACETSTETRECSTRC